MTREQKYASELTQRFCALPPTQSPFQWVIENIVFNEPEVKGRFDPHGRKYLEEILNNIANDSVHDETLCTGTGVGKTISTMAKVAWAMHYEPFRGLWVMPSKEGEGGARSFNSTRFQAMLKETKCLAEKFPRDRHKMKGLQLAFGGNVLGFVGSNSPAQVGSNRCRIVVLDEQDKFKQELSEEAGAAYLAFERTKNVASPKRIATSTPTVETNPIWKRLLTSDLRRRFLPCPHCSKKNKNVHEGGYFVLVKNEQYSVLPNKFEDGKPIPMAALTWDNEAKRKDGSWDMDRVIRSARFECPHCKGHIRDEHRTWQDENGLWIPTRAGILYHRGYHLSSFYAPMVDFDSSYGGMAKKFLDCHASGDGMRGYINSDLAEVDSSQEHASVRIVSHEKVSQTDWIPLMTVDVQKLWPYLWFIIRKWSTFKLQEPFPLDEKGIPIFAQHLDAKPELKLKCMAAINGLERAWKPLAELLRFDPCTGEFPALDWIICQKIVGEHLCNLFEQRCESDTIKLGKYIYQQMGTRMPKGGDSESIAVGHCQTDDWEELKELFHHYKVGKGLPCPNYGMAIDAGYQEKNNPEVLRKCYETATQFGWYDPLSRNIYGQAVHAQCKPVPLDNWQPYKGYPIKKRWLVDGIQRDWHYGFHDPFNGTARADRCVIRVLEAASDYYYERWQDLRERQTEEDLKRGRNIWSIAGDVDLFPADKFQMKDYRKQLDARYRDRDGKICNRGSGGMGSRVWPDHLNDCERNQFALASSLGIFSYDTK